MLKSPPLQDALALRIAIALLFGTGLSSASAQGLSDDEIVSSTSLTDSVHARGIGLPETLFESIPPERSGISLSYPIEPNHPLARLYPFGWAAGGVAIGDVNGDGKADLFFAGGPVKNRLYLQVGDFQFFDVTARAGVAGGTEWGAAAAFADIDNDGDLDLLVGCYDAPNRLFLNQTEGQDIRFEDKAEEFGMALADGTLNGAFADFDRDGFLEFFLQTYHLEPETGRPEKDPRIGLQNGIIQIERAWSPFYYAFAGPDGKPAWREAGRPDFLLRSGPTGRFRDFSGTSRMALGRTYGTSLTWTDLDHDGFPDLYLGNDGADPDLLYHNRGDRTLSLMTSGVIAHTPWFSRGTVAADFNNDLLVDLLAANSGGRSVAEDLAIGFPLDEDRRQMITSGGTPQVFRNHLLINSGAALFVDIAQMAGLSHTGATWSTKAADFDNDGRIDLFFTNGGVRDPWLLERGALEGDNLIGKTRWDLLREHPERREPNRSYRNLGSFRFEDSSKSWGLDHVGMSHAAASGDLDGDGDLDLVVCHAGEPVGLYRNHSQGNRVRLRLEGKKSNTWGLGAEVLLAAGDRIQMRQLYPQSGFLGSDEPVIHFGLGQVDQIDRLTITWPSGAVETLENLGANRTYTIREAASLLPPLSRIGRAEPLFEFRPLFRGVGQRLAPPSDTPQTLAPSWLRRLGSGQAWSDLDGDGKPELYAGGSQGRSGRFVTQSPAVSKAVQPFAEDAACEDLGAVFFDADNDGDLDLYVASGGPEGAGTDRLRDRLYLNEDLQFRKAAPDHLPDHRDSSGPIAAADFDRDGDVDLFVGSRLIAGAYPTAPESRLLLNDGTGKFDSSAAATIAPGLQNSGMVTGALWTDFDDDGWLDLLLTQDWGGIRVWKNQEGRLVDSSAEVGTADLLGRWNGIAGGDLDGDGDIDYVVTNNGLNTGATASRERPLSIFHAPFFADEQPLLLETLLDPDTGKAIPLRRHSEWLAAVPELAERFPDSRSFAEAALGLDGLFPAEARNRGLQLSVHTLESGVLINDGGERLVFQPLPRIAQTSPAFGAVLADLNLDGRLDCYLVQNRETVAQSPNPADGGLSLLLLGTGNPENLFQPVWADESGLLVPELGRSVSVVDLDSDDRPDLVVGLSESDPKSFFNRAPNERFHSFRVDFADQDGAHPSGARVRVETEGLPIQVAEYHAGSGYLSQSPASFFFVAPRAQGGKASAKITIHWPGGKQTERTIYFD